MLAAELTDKNDSPAYSTELGLSYVIRKALKGGYRILNSF